MREYLESELAERMEALTGNSKILRSMIEGSVVKGRADPVDLQMLLSRYRQLTEINTLVRIYNENFDDETIKKLEAQMVPRLEETEESLSRLLKKLVD